VTDEAFIRGFESTTLPKSEFTHRSHVRAAWWYLRQAPLPEAMSRFIASLRRYAAAHNAAAIYHETITVAWILLIAERVGAARELEWEAFAARYPELFEKSLMARYYQPETLASDRARQGFVMPDRVVFEESGWDSVS
jgi:hypothetical protein